MSHDHFDGITEFTLTARFASFTAAAEQLGVTSSAVGKAVSRLETRLGVKLLHRTTRKLTLTSEGDAYLASCQRVVEDLTTTEDGLSTGALEPRGRLRIDLPGAFGRRYVAPTLIALAQRYHLATQPVHPAETADRHRRAAGAGGGTSGRVPARGKRRWRTVTAGRYPARRARSAILAAAATAWSSK